MGRHGTGAWTVYESMRLELPWLLRSGYIEKGKVLTGQISWKDRNGNQTANVAFKSSYIPAASNYFELSYTVGANGGQKLDYNYRIYFVEVPSNLGFGQVLYFQCPQTFKKCRILYMAYGSHKFKSREAYGHRLYYDCQIASKLSKYNDSYWRLQKQLDNLRAVSSCGKRKYEGKLTGAARRFNRLTEKQELKDTLRWTIGVPKAFRGMMM